jgi:putative addiction module component (TIGR02574 family)
MTPLSSITSASSSPVAPPKWKGPASRSRARQPAAGNVASEAPGRFEICRPAADGLWHALAHHPRDTMPTRVEDLAAQALSLPPEDRAELVERLLASFEPRLSAQAAWMSLAQLRRDDVKSGKTAMVPGDEAFARARARLG